MTSDQLHTQSPEPIVTSDPKPVSPPYLAYVGINEAARLVGKAKQQIYRDIEAGRLSWNLDTPGKKLLQIADLDRIYKLKPKGVTGNITGHKNQELPQPNADVTTSKTVATEIELAVLKERLAARDEALRQAQDEIRDLRENRDKLLEQNTRFTLLLTAQAEPTEPQPAPAPWYKRLFK